MDHFTKNEKLFTDEPQAEDTKVSENDSEIVATIKEIMETRIRPVVQEDGGEIEYLRFIEDTGVLLFFSFNEFWGLFVSSFFTIYKRGGGYI